MSIHSKHVLIVDGGPEGHSLAAWLASDGYRCAVEPGAPEALRACRRIRPGTMVLGLEMAREHGEALVAGLRELAPRARLVILSDPGAFDPHVAGRLRIDDWVGRPVARGELLRAVAPSRRAAASRADVDAFRRLLCRSNRAAADRGVRAREVARLLAEELGLPDSHVEEVAAAALLHEVGLVGLPPSIGGSDAPPRGGVAREMYRLHPEIGARLLEATAGLEGVARLVRAAHERFDGTGYPRRLQGAAIPIGARIVAVAAAYEMLLPRDRTSVVAGAELARGAGTAFDPDVVAAWFQLAERQFVPCGALAI